jgi:hypothetical protein
VSPASDEAHIVAVDRRLEARAKQDGYGKVLPRPAIRWPLCPWRRINMNAAYDPMRQFSVSGAYVARKASVGLSRAAFAAG